MASNPTLGLTQLGRVRVSWVNSIVSVRWTEKRDLDRGNTIFFFYKWNRTQVSRLCRQPMPLPLPPLSKLKSIKSSKHPFSSKSQMLFLGQQHLIPLKKVKTAPTPATPDTSGWTLLPHKLIPGEKIFSLPASLFGKRLMMQRFEWEAKNWKWEILTAQSQRPVPSC